MLEAPTLLSPSLTYHNWRLPLPLSSPLALNWNSEVHSKRERLYIILAVVHNIGSQPVIPIFRPYGTSCMPGIWRCEDKFVRELEICQSVFLCSGIETTYYLWLVAFTLDPPTRKTISTWREPGMASANVLLAIDQRELTLSHVQNSVYQ